MNNLSKAVLGVAISAMATSAGAAIIKFEAAGGDGTAGMQAANDARNNFDNGTYNQVTETFDEPGEFVASNPVTTENGVDLDAYDSSNQQESWVVAQESFNTRVGTITNVREDGTADETDPATDKLMIENEDTGEFGRDANLDGQWLDSNDAEIVEWDIDDGNGGKFNALGFFLSDANDQGASLEITFADGLSKTLNLNEALGEPTNERLGDGNIAWITLYSDVFFDSATLTFDNGVNENDGWGIDDMTIARVPEPGTLALLGLGLAGLSLTRRRRS
ncbi:PEP-CTERM sorting domain-containing protein [Marinobacter sp.]|uniref:PEP-CTERM sorting domain-containing protein n=1 Tax=Marinobacter sp. TaxID=50741 RepID=UPI0035633176